MDNSDSAGPSPGEPRVSPGVVPPRKPRGDLKWIALVIALLVVISVLGILSLYHPTGSSVTIENAPDLATLNSPYNLGLQTNGVFKNITVYWGDSSVQTFAYQGTNKVTYTHDYSQPGNYLIYYVANFGGSTVDNTQNLIPVHASTSTVSEFVSYGLMQLQTNSTSATPIVNNTMIYKPGTSLSFIDGYYSAPSNTSFAVVGQTLEYFHNGSLVSSTVLPYGYSYADGQYELPNNMAYSNLSFSGSGIYALGLQTTTAVPITSTSVASDVINTSVATYTAGQTVTYGNMTQLGYGTNLNYSSSPPMLTYSAGTNVTNYKNTNITYMGANVTYKSMAYVSLPLGKTISAAAGANLTTNGYTNVTFLNNVTAKTSAGTMHFNNTTAYYALTSGEWVNFSATAMFTVYNTSLVQNFSIAKDSNFVFGQKFGLTDWNMNTVMYNKDSSLMYTNSTTIVKYPDKTNVTITLDVTGTTPAVNVGQIDPTQGIYTSTFYIDVASFTSAKQYTAPVVGSTFTSAEVAPGGYTSLDPQIAFYTLDSEILDNTMMTLLGYNGNSTSQFVPLAATAVPTVANGGINSAATSYTFHINTSLKWQDGTHLSAYDAYYGIVRDLLFTNGHPGTGGYLLAAYLLPAPYYNNVDYTNITKAVTYSNTTENLTLNFVSPMPASLVFQLVVDNEASPIDASWVIAHGGGIQFTPSGFQNYTKFGSSSGYNTYLQNNIMSNGPYVISYNLPGSEIVMVPNQNFVSPGPWFPAPSIKTVVLQYLSQPSTAFLELESGAAQSAIGIPATPYWPEIQHLNKEGFLHIDSFPTIGIYFFNFNMYTNETLLHTIVHNANVPSTLFVNPNIREVFNYAFNYSTYFATDIGNALYNTTFQQGFVGMLPTGMLYNQSIAQLMATGFMGSMIHNQNGTSYADMKNATKYWNYFVNDPTSDGFKANGLSWAGTIGSSDVMYKGAPLVIPIFVPAGDSPDAAAVSQWGDVLSTIIPGATFPVETATYTQIFATWAVPGGNPMPVSWGGWAPDYVYPTDYEESMSLPSNLSTYMAPASWNPWFIGGGNATFNNPTPNMTEKAQLNQELSDYNNATSNGTNPAAAKFWFQKVNYEIINTSINVNLGQPIFYWTISGKISESDIQHYQTNLMIGGGNELYYNLLSYT